MGKTKIPNWVTWLYSLEAGLEWDFMLVNGNVIILDPTGTFTTPGLAAEGTEERPVSRRLGSISQRP